MFAAFPISRSNQISELASKVAHLLPQTVQPEDHSLNAPALLLALQRQPKSHNKAAESLNELASSLSLSLVDTIALANSACHSSDERWRSAGLPMAVLQIASSCVYRDCVPVQLANGSCNHPTQTALIQMD